MLYCRGQPSKTDSRRFLVVPLVHRFSIPVLFSLVSCAPQLAC
ncbi:hypothetical protein BIFANG_03148 [Bifidobacterium angulatum DSM 20098 = JCM 7096]|uniref:Uncharacterized protein n=1 Tax=Bifidobacterium angulatum DSM 20098 = JCM 7096 TaxID=518635 RepID=C4FFN4_9BIFI|nr:hypothetical protein BIFANG_03148 [Bifidobacterium angulatum DSM 20098 = JCM 7096]